MRVLLVDVDSTIPNLALMKISAYHKSIGDSITLKKCNIKIYKLPKQPITIDAFNYDKIYISAIFNNTISSINVANAKWLDVGGSGVDLKKTLPNEIKLQEPDYSIYPDNDTSYGFISRGCFRKCYFCIVPEKEGNIHQEVQSVTELIRHKKIKFLDNNFLGLINYKQFLQELIDLKIKCQFNQGLDIRLINDENVEMLSRVNYLGDYIFAFDKLEDRKIVEKKLAILKKYIKQPWRIKFFLYCHPDMNIPNDV